MLGLLLTLTVTGATALTGCPTKDQLVRYGSENVGDLDGASNAIDCEPDNEAQCETVESETPAEPCPGAPFGRGAVVEEASSSRSGSRPGSRA